MDSTHSYVDLDELIVNHIQAMARRVEELMAHEKFKHGSEDDLRKPDEHYWLSIILIGYSFRHLLEKLRSGEPRQEHVRVHPES